MDELGRPAIEALRGRRVRFHPESQHRFAIESLEQAPDWCISRQLWWGHRIPVWTCENGHRVSVWPPPDACAECGSSVLERDPDVLDTWFSSALWPLATLGWPDETPELERYYTGDVNVNARPGEFLRSEGASETRTMRPQLRRPGPTAHASTKRE